VRQELPLAMNDFEWKDIQGSTLNGQKSSPFVHEDSPHTMEMKAHSLQTDTKTPVSNQNRSLASKTCLYLGLIVVGLLMRCATAAPLFPAPLPITPTAYVPQIHNGLIAFEAQNDHGNVDIYVMQPDGSQLQRLTKYTVSDSNPAWSPDGIYILYSHNGDIYRINADGTNPQLLFARPHDTLFYTGVGSFRWSPDGTKIAFITAGYICNNEEGPVYSALLVLDVDTGHTDCALSFPSTTYPQQPTNIQSLAWSPDGQRFAFTLAEGNTDITQIYVMNTDGTDLRQVTTSDTTHGASPQWLPDGNRLIFQVFERKPAYPERREVYPDKASYYVIDTDGGNFRPALTIPDWEGDIRWESGWSPLADGRFALVWLRNREIDSMSVATIDTRTLTSVSIRKPGERSYRWQMMSPDMQKILYQDQGGYSIMNADGTDSQPFNAAPLEIQNPSWQPVWK
jgi:Tol biopolymer transport system component